MKKFLMSVSVVAATCLVMSSCLKNNNDNYVAPVDPSVEAPELQSFIDSTGYNMVTQSTPLEYYGYNSSTGKYELTDYTASYLYYEIVDPGDLTAGKEDVSDASLGGTVGGTTTVYNTISDSTLYVSGTYVGTLLDGTVFDESYKDKPFFAPVPQLILAWQLLLNKVGRGGHIRILTPSYYGYSNVAQTGIPANSPLYFDVYINGYVSNSYGGN